jgi:2,3-bisphosphoglycerate-independent phosphoglycerate mutase
MKGVFVVLDGVADESCKVLGGKTPLQAAKTPNLDIIAGHSKLDYCYTVREGVAPESSAAVVSLLGQDPAYAPRGVLEAMGAGVSLKAGDLALRCNLGTIDYIETRNILDRRAGRTLTTKEARKLAKGINTGLKERFKFEFFPTIGHRGVLVFRGGFSDNISNIDPAYSGGAVSSGNVAKVEFAKPLDDEDDSKLSADIVNSFVRNSHKILDEHPVNKKRAKKGLYAANFVLCRDAGSEKIKFDKMKGKWMALGYMPLEIGIARAAGMEVYKFKYPKLRGMDVYENLYDGLNKAIKNAIRMLRWYRKKYDYFYIHFKETDVPGHDNKPFDKVKMIEILDKKFFGFLKKFLDKNQAKLVLTADHTTSSRLKAHSAEPVPVLSYSAPAGEKKEKRFTEEEGRKGRKIMGRKLLDERLFVKR